MRARECMCKTADSPEVPSFCVMPNIISNHTGAHSHTRANTSLQKYSHTHLHITMTTELYCEVEKAHRSPIETDNDQVSQRIQTTCFCVGSFTALSSIGISPAYYCVMWPDSPNGPAPPSYFVNPNTSRCMVQANQHPSLTNLHSRSFVIAYTNAHTQAPLL